MLGKTKTIERLEKAVSKLIVNMNRVLIPSVEENVQKGVNDSFGTGSWIFLDMTLEAKIDELYRVARELRRDTDLVLKHLKVEVVHERRESHVLKRTKRNKHVGGSDS